MSARVLALCLASFALVAPAGAQTIEAAAQRPSFTNNTSISREHVRQVTDAPNWTVHTLVSVGKTALTIVPREKCWIRLEESVAECDGFFLTDYHLVIVSGVLYELGGSHPIEEPKVDCLCFLALLRLDVLRALTGDLNSSCQVRVLAEREET